MPEDTERCGAEHPDMPGVLCHLKIPRSTPHEFHIAMVDGLPEEWDGFDEIKLADRLPPRLDKDGVTYDRRFDFERLNDQTKRVYWELLKGGWLTLADISASTGDPEASVSARIRDLRKTEYGGVRIDKRRVAGVEGLWEYQMIIEHVLS